jgi:cation transport regulator
MPYSSNSELPKAVRQTVPEDKHTEFRSVFNRVFEDTDSEQRAFRAAWSAVEKGQEEEIDKSVMDTLRDKAKTFNEKYGEKHGRVSASKLKEVYDRGIGAYKTNPGSVRPNVKSKEQWAYARVNSFLDIVRGKKSPKHDKDLLPKKKMLKAAYANDIFTTEMEARARSMDLGLGGAIHVHEYYGQAVYMPGESHSAYLEHYSDDLGMDPAEEDYSPRMDSTEALRAVVAEIMCKADYQGKEVTLNKPFRLPSGSSKKFGVYVKDGDKTKKVTFGSPDMEIRRDDPDARRNFRARHNCDTATDKTSARYWSCRMWEEDISVSEMTKADIEGQILKADEEQRMVWGWASVVTEKGEPVVDRQGDVIEPETLVKAVNKFMEHVRVGKQMHDGGQIGVVVHSMPITKEIGDSLGIQSDREGWIVAFKVYDDDVWAKVKSGELAAFSIGGRAVKEDYSG